MPLLQYKNSITKDKLGHLKNLFDYILLTYCNFYEDLTAKIALTII